MLKNFFMGLNLKLNVGIGVFAAVIRSQDLAEKSPWPQGSRRRPYIVFRQEPCSGKTYVSRIKRL